MDSGSGVRIAGCVAGVVFGVVTPAMMLWRVLIGDPAVEIVTAPVIVGIAASGISGIWLLLVSLLAPVSELRKVLEPFEGAEAVVLFLPVMLLTGTRAIWRALHEKCRTRR